MAACFHESPRVPVGIPSLTVGSRDNPIFPRVPMGSRRSHRSLRGFPRQTAKQCENCISLAWLALGYQCCHEDSWEFPRETTEHRGNWKGSPWIPTSMGPRFSRGCQWEFQRGPIGIAGFSRGFILVLAVPAGKHALWSSIVRYGLCVWHASRVVVYLVLIIFTKSKGFHGTRHGNSRGTPRQKMRELRWAPRCTMVFP